MLFIPNHEKNNSWKPLAMAVPGSLDYLVAFRPMPGFAIHLLAGMIGGGCLPGERAVAPGAWGRACSLR
jgi:hypothetical protein